MPFLENVFSATAVIYVNPGTKRMIGTRNSSRTRNSSTYEIPCSPTNSVYKRLFANGRHGAAVGEACRSGPVVAPVNLSGSSKGVYSSTPQELREIRPQPGHQLVLGSEDAFLQGTDVTTVDTVEELLQSCKSMNQALAITSQNFGYLNNRKPEYFERPDESHQGDLLHDCGADAMNLTNLIDTTLVSVGSNMVVDPKFCFTANQSNGKQNCSSEGSAEMMAQGRIGGFHVAAATGAKSAPTSSNPAVSSQQATQPCNSQDAPGNRNPANPFPSRINNTRASEARG